jgi:mono/diheme cytochrome c family protein
MRARTIGMVFLIGLAVVLACSSTMAQGNPSRGLALSERWCSQCHGVTPNEGSHNADAPRFVDVAAEPSVTEYSLRVFFRTPHATMPNFVLNPDDIEDIISYILSMKPNR